LRVRKFHFRKGEAILLTLPKQHIREYFQQHQTIRKYLQQPQTIREYLQQHKAISIIAGHIVVMITLAATLFGPSFSKSLGGVFAHASCLAGHQAHTVMNGETLSSIAMNNHTNWQQLQQQNTLSNPDMIYAGQTICMPSDQQSAPFSAYPEPSNGSIGDSNPFPYGQCTYWADERYHTLHGVYVPWMSNANAWQWTTRANQYHWNVSSTPTIGAIIDLQSGVQGASGYGHVAVVEKIVDSSHVLASNMNWGGGASVTYTTFATGYGVTFITY
jgi:surface antigen